MTAEKKFNSNNSYLCSQRRKVASEDGQGIGSLPVLFYFLAVESNHE